MEASANRALRIVRRKAIDCGGTESQSTRRVAVRRRREAYVLKKKQREIVLQQLFYQQFPFATAFALTILLARKKAICS